MSPRALLTLISVFLQGCESVRDTVRSKLAGKPQTPPHAANFFLPPLPDKSLPMRRVAMLPLSGGGFTAEALRDVTAAVQGELSRKTLFEVVPVSGADLEAICGQRQISSVESIPAALLHTLHERLGAEGVLFTDITAFHPYRPVAIGVRAKLVDIGSGAISWACDVVFDSDDGGSVLISPARFAKFAANEAFNSLNASSTVPR
jgi:hypothetical protein